MRTIVVIVSDNDFSNTFIPLLKTVKSVCEWRDEDDDTINEEFIVKIIKEGIKFHVTAFQSDKGDSPADIEDTTAYLLKHLRVLFDEEAEKDIIDPEVMRDGGAWYLDLRTGVVNSY